MVREINIAGQSVPAVGIGTWHMGSEPGKHDEELKAIQAGIEAGARAVDTAEVYGQGKSEMLVGEALQPFDRDDIFLISKVKPENASKTVMEHHLDASLKRLQTDHLDLYLYHWRGPIPLEETVAELDRLRSIGKIGAWGVSNFDIPDMQELVALPAGGNVAANEDLYNIESRGIEYDLLPWQHEQHIPLIAYSPVGGLSNNLDTSMLTDPDVRKVAARHGVSTYELLIAWAVRDGNTLAIPQTSNPEHMCANIAAAGIELTDEDLAQLDKRYPAPTHRIPLDVD
ncbi:aldo/keto reductase [Bifidobacterium sp. ESL0745]|uniref:aldo/keto reductase n=1 Tax=Bifidobacterium sp. ESL0745 TaxID=2983226 RepID=UPI0023F7D87A|nr:aldo/keto reductase [Bifidobacterium sp. ESL0745]MDF7664898.1 aldo/keto reductase [Bifidobacterium sp. ESL0745]